MKRRIAIATATVSVAVVIVVLVMSQFGTGDTSVVVPVPESAIRNRDVLSQSVAPTSVEISKDAYPVHIIIPSIGVDAKVEKVGLTRRGTMATPRRIANVGWYSYGSAPGENGSAVLAGHVDNGLGLPGVFHSLKDLQTGSPIYLFMSDGLILQFKATAHDTYSYSEDTDPDIFSENGPALVRLITCTGRWIESALTYDTRLVITANLEGEISQINGSR